MSTKKGTVLIVDDSQIVRKETAVAVEAHGYQVVEAENGAEGVKIFGVTPSIVLIITDVHMPVMNGIEMAEELTRTVGAKLPPILVASTESNPDMKTRGRKAGVAAWIIKPVDMKSLLQGVDILVEKFKRTSQG